VQTLIHLIYCSAAPRPLSRDDLRTLLIGARRYNELHGITGMLLYAEGTFFQVLEGAPDDVERLFVQISADARHDHITVIIREPVAVRAFSEWSMGHAELTPQDLDAIVGANDFFSSGRTFADIGEGRAKKLLAAFRDGRWRAALGTPPAPAEQERQPASRPALRYAFAFQPIVHVPTRSIFSYEALIRGPAGESAASVLEQLQAPGTHALRGTQRLAPGVHARPLWTC